MQQTYELRVLERFASRLFRESEGEKLGTTVRKIRLRDDDPRLTQVAALQTELNTAGEMFFAGWVIHRRYSKTELASADLLHLRVTRIFEPPGADCGTIYDDTGACPRCGAGAPRESPLILDVRRIPRRDMAMTIAREVVVSSRLAEVFHREGVTGVRFVPVYTKKTVPLLPCAAFREPIVTDNSVVIAPETRFGSGLFGRPEDGLYRCPEGDLLGLNALSELYLESLTRGTDDVVATRQFVGVRRGDLRPHRFLLVSPKVGRILLREKFTGFKLEVAHLV